MSGESPALQEEDGGDPNAGRVGGGRHTSSSSSVRPWDERMSSRIVTFQHAMNHHSAGGSNHGNNASYAMLAEEDDDEDDEDDDDDEEEQGFLHDDLDWNEDDDDNDMLDTDKKDREQDFRSGGWGRFIPFRSPLPTRQFVKQASLHRDSKRMEYPNSIQATSTARSVSALSSEDSPLLSLNKSSQDVDDSEGRTSSLSGRSDVNQSFLPLQRTPSEANLPSRKNRIKIAYKFLSDYENGRPPSLPQDLVHLNATILQLHDFKYSKYWVGMVYLALLALILSSCYEGGPREALSLSLNAFGVAVFVVDLYVLHRLFHQSDDQNKDDHHHRFNLWWFVPMCFLLVGLTAELLYVAIFVLPAKAGSYKRFFHWCSALKPIAIFYVSDKARQALEALRMVFPIVFRVLILELLLILSFAAVAHQLFPTHQPFSDLANSWLNLFELSTTVVNPRLWMPEYNDNPDAAFFFIIFDTTIVFIMHSLVLSVVFQTYIQAMSEIHDRSMQDREDALRLAYLALEVKSKDGNHGFVKISSLTKVLRKLRPHYNEMKIGALVEILDPSKQRTLDFPTYLGKIRMTLIASIRTTPSRSNFAYLVEATAAFVAFANFVYVILYTSQFSAVWFDNSVFEIGIALTFLSVFELTARINPFKLLDYTPTTRLQATFDGLALLGATVSVWGALHYFLSYQTALDLMLTGRAIDMIRIMRFFRIFRAMVRRSGDVFIALTGQLALIASSLHLYVYLGIALWAGAIHVGTYGNKITPLYDLNNFNTYTNGLVTMFQVLVVNDWYAIAAVYQYASAHSSPYIVYPFFVSANLICVNIMLNCLTAFFVGAFVAKLDDSEDDGKQVRSVSRKTREMIIGATSSVRTVRRVASVRSMGDSSEASGMTVEFDIYEREGFDRIVQTVAGSTEEEEDEYAKKICDMLEVFERLSAQS